MEAPLSPVALSSPRSPGRLKSPGASELVVEVEVPPGPLGIMLDGDALDRPVLEGFASVSAEEQQPGAVELSGRVPPGSLLAGVNEYDFAESRMTFAEVGGVLRDTSHLTRTLRFLVPQSPASDASDNNNKEETPMAPMEPARRLSTEFAEQRQLPPMEPASESDSEPDDDALASDEEYEDESDSDAESVQHKASDTHELSSRDSLQEIDDAQAQTQDHAARMTSMASPEPPRTPPSTSTTARSDASAQQAPPATLSPMGSSTTVASKLMAATPQPQEDEAEAEFVTAEAPPGPLGLNLDGGVLDAAVVLGFAKLRDGARGALETHGGIPPGSVLVRVNGQDVSHATLADIQAKLGALSQQHRTLVFRLPSETQQTQQEQRASVLRATGLHRAPTLPPFEEDLARRRHMELALVMRFDKTTLRRRECWLCIDAQWMARWVAFAARDGPLPGPISNETLLQPEWRDLLAPDAPGRPDTARPGLQLQRDYRVVAPMVWCLFAELHGLGEAPLLPRYVMDIYAEPVSAADVAAMLQVPRPQATAMANDLRDKCLVRPSDFS